MERFGWVFWLATLLVGCESTPTVIVLPGVAPGDVNQNTNIGIGVGAPAPVFTPTPSPTPASSPTFGGAR